MTGSANTLLHRSVLTPSGRIHLVEQGDGPLVLFVHGFPESWYSWRHQLPAVAAAGFRAVAIDVRGYGRSSRPVEIEQYGMVHHVADNVGVVEALGESTAIVVGHDWGSPIAANSVLLRPDVFTALGLLSVPYSPRGSHRPTEVFARLGGDEQFYINYFQEPGRPELEVEPDVRTWLTGIYASMSGDSRRPADGGPLFTIPVGHRMSDRFAPDAPRPPWLTEADLDFLVTEFEYSGFAGAFNRYRNVDRDWADLAAYDGQPITVPSIFVGGERDGPWLAAGVAGHSKNLPGLQASHVLPKCGHWVQQERPDEVNRVLVDWLTALPV